MSLELLGQLEAKVQTTLDSLEMLRMEMEDLKEENATLKSEKEAWENRLGQLLGRFSELETSTDADESSEAVATSEEAATDDEESGF